ncbi:tetratricopeptide repeat protein [candidate division KSB1 bacterium]|nr:tetratricopeptide repeat protein [candidate division KSB1 bacterium]
MSVIILTCLLAFHSAFAQEHVIRAGKFFFQKDYENAIKEYRLAIEENPNDALLWYNIGISYENVGQIKSAIDAHRRAIELQPDFTRAQDNLNKLLSGSKGKTIQVVQSIMLQANNAFFIKDYDEAITHYSKVLELDRKDFTAQFNLGYCYEQKNNYKDALKAYQKAVKLDSTSQKAKVAVTRTETIMQDEQISILIHQLDSKIENDQLREAQNLVQKILAIDPGNGWALSKREIIQRKLKQRLELTTSDKIQTDGEKGTPPPELIKDSTIIVSKDTSQASVQEADSNSTGYLFALLLVIVIVAAVLMLKSKRRTGGAASEFGKGVYDILQDYYNMKRTGILSITGQNDVDEKIRGEVRILKGNIIDAHTNKAEGSAALYQMLELEQPEQLTFQEVQVSQSGNIHQATLPLLMQWTLGMKKKENNEN